MTLKYPYPCKAWFTIANDPDNTRIADWQELDAFIWEELKLPISNSLFVKSYNQNLPQQVNLVDYPEIASQKYDTIHTWGDYMHARSKGFDRDDAIEACEILNKYGIEPKVLTDHSGFTGNILHRDQSEAIPQTKDASGIVYKNYVYTLDIIKKIGINYAWDGKIIYIIGQDRKLAPYRFFSQQNNSFFKAFIKTFLYYVLPENMIKALKINIFDNQQYFLRKFPDGNSLYCFIRYGKWADADIYGLAKIVSQKNIDTLLRSTGTMVVYTHIGKRPVGKEREPFHISPESQEALQYIKKKYDEKELAVSSVSDLLDYLVLRDNIKYDIAENSIELMAYGIRYKNIIRADVSGKKFSFHKGKFNLDKLLVGTAGAKLEYEVMQEKDPDIFSLLFK